MGERLPCFHFSFFLQTFLILCNFLLIHLQWWQFSWWLQLTWKIHSILWFFWPISDEVFFSLPSLIKPNRKAIALNLQHLAFNYHCSHFHGYLFNSCQSLPQLSFACKIQAPLLFCLIQICTWIFGHYWEKSTIILCWAEKLPLKAFHNLIPWPYEHCIVNGSLQLW